MLRHLINCRTIIIIIIIIIITHQLINMHVFLSDILCMQMSTTRNLLCDEPLFDVHARTTDVDTELRHLVCSVFIRALETLPALVRQWWTALDRRSSDVVRTSK